MRWSGRIGVGVFVVGALLLSCSQPVPEGPTAVAADNGSVTAGQSSRLVAFNHLPDARFVIHPSPPTGQPPFEVCINMCKSTDPDPEDNLRYTVDWGDGDKSRGSCRLDHVYQREGSFPIVACVSDRVFGEEPTCRRWTVDAAVEVPVSCKVAFGLPTEWLATGYVADPRCTCSLNGVEIPWTGPGSFGAMCADLGGGSWNWTPAIGCWCVAP